MCVGKWKANEPRTAAVGTAEAAASRARNNRRLGSLVASDYQRLYSYKHEQRLAHVLMFAPRMITNPSLHAALLIRLYLAGPRQLHWLWRNILIAKHSIDVHAAVEIGPGLELPHPVAIVIGGTTVIGRNVVLCQNVTLGSRQRHPNANIKSQVAPIVEDDVTIYPGSIVVGNIRIGSGATIGAHLLIDRDVPPGAVFTARSSE